jgi:hypothetical protein
LVRCASLGAASVFLLPESVRTVERHFICQTRICAVLAGSGPCVPNFISTYRIYGLSRHYLDTCLSDAT